MKSQSLFLVMCLLLLTMGAFVHARLVSGVGTAPMLPDSSANSLFEDTKAFLVNVITIDFSTDATGKLTDKTHNAELFLRIMMGILLFSLLYSLINMVFKSGFTSGSKISIALVISIMSTVVIPGSFLLYLATAYGFVFFIILVGGLIAGLIYLMFYVFQADDVPHRFAKGVASVVAFVLLRNLAELQFAVYASPYQEWATLTKTTTGFLSFVFGIGALYYFASALFRLFKPNATAQPSAFARLEEVSQAVGRIGGAGGDDAEKLVERVSDVLTALGSTNTVAELTAAVGVADRVYPLAGKVRTYLIRNASRVAPGDRAAFTLNSSNMSIAVSGLRTELTAVTAALAGGPAGPIPPPAAAARGRAMTEAQAILTTLGNAVALIP
ncbi:MAG TPA: hypothetical protein VJJ82_03370 [Candidatus Nanoarchaeia archaeon]|nr:hypothetical protein [Candidatus Nanoarchaeia archaeon]